ncbi:DUF3592 domain-containing protein [Amycolatopsis sp. BJA-103]|uniref:DUF3592 domain-containing protein n=1 Tax=Amycolatopsis sp. BJA-103 TaxID=1911175 RepID=UPI000C78CD0F|nr:DUF3592 domain-containing protein [Amycolatopsis sp. BJA-103]AUI63152.1 hypothetical protein BKN51_36730 [Amycolatopsis sp. BJA-103]PNE18997.1 hypothetical protein B1H26_14435 [Amycolatopsis sp. BJA-103]
MTAKAERVRRIGWYAALVVASLVTVLGVSLLFAAFRNDSAIEAELGQATAQVESVTFDRTIINYATPDGIVHSPANGVLYPAGLAAGQLVNIEYDVGDPELARVAGRSAANTLLPLGSMIFFTWLVAGPLLWWIRRQRLAHRRSLAEAIPAPEHAA